MAVTTNYNWTTPDDVDLVKDGAAAIRTLGTAIDTTVFTNAGASIAKSLVDAKGDIIAATADNTVDRLAVGANDTVLTADSSTATGLKWASAAAGGMTLLSSGTLSGASVALTSIDQSYVDLVLMIFRYDPSVDGEYIKIRVNNDSTANYYAIGGTATQPTFNKDSMYQTQGYDDTVNYGIERWTFFNYSESNLNKYVQNQKMPTNLNGVVVINSAQHGGYYLQTAITEINLLPSSGNMGGTYKLYGVK